MLLISRRALDNSKAIHLLTRPGVLRREAATFASMFANLFKVYSCCWDLVWKIMY